MSVYSAGVGEDLGDVPFLPQGAFSESPGLLKQDIETLDREIEGLWKDAQTSKMAGNQKAVIKSFLAEWNNFLKRHATYIDRSLFAKSTVRRVTEFRNRLEKFRDEMKRLKVKVTPPAPRVEIPFPEGRINWKKILLIVGGSAIAIGGGMYLYRRFRKPVQQTLPPQDVTPVVPAMPRVQHIVTV